MYKKKNFANSLLAAQLLIGGTTLNVTTGHGVKFGNTGSSELFMGVIWGANYGSPEQDSTREIVKCYRQAGAGNEDKIIILRAQESTSAKQWEIGDHFMLTATEGVWAELEDATIGYVTDEVPAQTPDGVITAFTTSVPFSPGTLDVCKNGVHLQAGAGNDYTVAANNQGYTFATPPATGDKILHGYLKNSNVMIQGSNSMVIGETPAGLVNSANVTYTLAGTPTGNIIVLLNGQVLTQGDDYSIAGQVITFTTAPLTGDAIRVMYLSVGVATGNADTLDNLHASFFQSNLRNYKIVPSVSSGNLTVDIKTQDGSNASPANPIPVKIGDTIRLITGALSITKNAGSNYCNAGSAELATKEIDYFVYLFWKEATSEVGVAFSRKPGVSLGGDVPGAATSENTALSNVAFALTDVFENIGRFAATLSAGAGYTWSVPTFTTKNLIQKPICETRWLDYNMVLAWTAGAAPTTEDNNYKKQKYKIEIDTCYLDFLRIFTVSGTTITQCTGTIPFSVSSLGLSSGNYAAISGCIWGSTFIPDVATVDSVTQKITISCATKTAAQFRGQGFYQI